MEDTPRQTVIKALKFQSPQRVPRQLWPLPWAQREYPRQLKKLSEDYPDDIVAAPDVYNPSPVVKGDPYEIGTYTDEWGCVFKNIHYGVIGEVREPILKEIKDYNKINPPYETLPENQQQAIDKVNKFCDQTDKFVLATACPRPWERYQFIRGSVNALMDIMTPNSEFEKLLNKIHDFYIKELQFWAKTNVDALRFMDDWGSQQNLLINPRQWRDIFKPMYSDYCEIAHNSDKFIFMHSDGNILQIYPDLIEIGVDAVNSQLFIMDMEKLSEIAKGKITFWGEIDRQHILIDKNPKVVKNAVRKVAKHLYDPSGGIIAQFEFGPGVQPENTKIIFQEWEKISQENLIKG